MKVEQTSIIHQQCFISTEGNGAAGWSIGGSVELLLQV